MSVLQSVTNYSNRDAFATRLRRKRADRIRALIDKIVAEQGNCRILDVGGEPRYWSVFEPDYLRQHNVAVTITNIAFDPALAIVPDPAVFTLAIEDGTHLSMPDGSYDLAHSNSVVEHLGGWPQALAFAHEIKRVARRYYVQTPAFGFPIEPHFGTPFFHWLPLPLRQRLLMRFALGHYPKAPSIGLASQWLHDAQLLSKAQFAYLFREGEIYHERILGMTKSFIAVRDFGP